MAYVRQEEGKENDVAVADISDRIQEEVLQSSLEAINNLPFNHAGSNEDCRNEREFNL